MQPHEFIGREAEARLIVTNTEAKRSSLIIGEAGVGKSALLNFIAPIIADEAKLIRVSKVAPLGTFLKELFRGMHEFDLIPMQSADVEKDLKEWGKNHPSNDEKAKNLMTLLEKTPDIVVMIDEAGGITATIRPWLERLIEIVTVVAAISPEALKKPGSVRFWKRFDEVPLSRFSRQEAALVLDDLMAKYQIQADDREIYRRKVLDLAQGSAFELARVVKYTSSDTLVNTGNLNTIAQSFVERDEKGIALAPLLFVVAAFAIASRYIARAQGDMDMYVISGILVAVMIVAGPFLRGSLKPRSG